jgi:hypothetical protein
MMDCCGPGSVKQGVTGGISNSWECQSYAWPVQRFLVPSPILLAVVNAGIAADHGIALAKFKLNRIAQPWAASDNTVILVNTTAFNRALLGSSCVSMRAARRFGVVKHAHPAVSCACLVCQRNL